MSSSTTSASTWVLFLSLASSAPILSSFLDKDWERDRRLSKAAAPFSKKAFCHWENSVGCSLCLSHRSETGTCSTRCSRKMATFCCGVNCRRVFSMGILSDAPLSSSPARYFQFRLKLHSFRKSFLLSTLHAGFDQVAHF